MTDRQAFLEIELATLYRVSEVLSCSLDLRETMQAVLKVLHEQGSLGYGMVSLVEPPEKAHGVVGPMPDIGDEVHAQHADRDRDPDRYGALIQQTDTARARPA